MKKLGVLPVDKNHNYRLRGYERLDSPEDDPFAPPENVVLVSCLHCGSRYQSSEMMYEDRGAGYLWYCKNKNCDGAGFGFDIFP